MLSSQFLEIIASNNKMRAMSTGMVTWAYGTELERGSENIGQDGRNYKGSKTG